MRQICVRFDMTGRLVLRGKNSTIFTLFLYYFRLEKGLPLLHLNKHETPSPDNNLSKDILKLPWQCQKLIILNQFNYRKLTKFSRLNWQFIHNSTEMQQKLNNWPAKYHEGHLSDSVQTFFFQKRMPSQISLRTLKTSDFN